MATIYARWIWGICLRFGGGGGGGSPIFHWGWQGWLRVGSGEASYTQVF